MSSSKRWKFKNIFTAEGGCGCGKAKLGEILEPRPRAKAAAYNDQTQPSFCLSSSSSWERGGGHSIDDDYTSTTWSLNFDTSPHSSERENDPNCTKMVSPCTRLSASSVAIVKDSDDPYQDFRQSMLQMILEKEIYSKDDLLELLNCFLELNSRSHHKIIVQAFMEIWNGVVSKRPELEKPCPQEDHR